MQALSLRTLIDDKVTQGVPLPPSPLPPLSI
jgi:hypothetical protein